MRTTVRVKVHLSKDLHWAATEAAKLSGLSLSDFVRQAVKEKLAGFGPLPRIEEDRGHNPEQGDRSR